MNTMNTMEKVNSVMDKMYRPIDRVEYSDLSKEEKRIYKQESRRLSGSGNLLNLRGLSGWNPKPFSTTVSEVVKVNINKDNTFGQNRVKWAW